MSFDYDLYVTVSLKDTQQSSRIRLGKFSFPVPLGEGTSVSVPYQGVPFHIGHVCGIDAVAKGVNPESFDSVAAVDFHIEATLQRDYVHWVGMYESLRQ